MEAAKAWFVVPKGVRVLEGGECRWSLIFVNFSFRSQEVERDGGSTLGHGSCFSEGGHLEGV